MKNFTLKRAFSVFWLLKSRLPLFVIGLSLLCTTVYAQERTVSGQVNDANGALPGVSIRIKNTNSGTVSDADGKYSLSVPGSDAILVFSFVGYENQEIPVGAQTNISVTLAPDVKILADVVVTALGVSKETKTVGYATQNVQGDVLNSVNTPNVGNMLSGQVAGLTVNNPTGLFQAPSFELRGRSPLIVLDGVPVSTDMYDINSNDIASISVLKGTAASAMYGSRGRFGAIMITTKRADKDGLTATFSQSTMITAGFTKFPHTQTEYGNGSLGKYEFWDGKDGGISDGDMIWGPKFSDKPLIRQWNSPIIDKTTGEEIPWWGDVDGTIYNDKSRFERKPTPWEYHNNLKDFLRTGVVSTTDFSVTQKSEKSEYRFSGTFNHQYGQVPNSALTTGGFNVNSTYYLTKSLTLDTRLQYNKVYSPNYPRHGYGPRNHMYTILVWMGDDVDGQDLRDHLYVPGQYGYRQANFNYAWYNNVYFAAYELNQEHDEDVLKGQSKLTWQINDNLSIFGRSNVASTHTFDDRESPKTYLNYGDPRDGDYKTWNTSHVRVDNDVLATYAKEISSDFAFNVNAGASSFYQKWQQEYAATDGLIVPRVYSLSNTKNPVKAYTSYSANAIRSLYGSVNLEFMDAIFFTGAYRKDWNSTLPEVNRSYDYPSASLSVLLSRFIDMPASFDFVKLYGAWADVYAALSPYQIENTYSNAGTFGSTQKMSYSSVINNPDILPERSTSFEFGLESAILENKGRINLTYYNVLDRNQILQAPNSLASGFTSRYVNGNEYTTKGLEVVLMATPVKTDNFKYDILLNVDRRVRRITQILDDADRYSLYKLNDRMDTHFARDWNRAADGRLVINETSGLPIRNSYYSSFGHRDPNFRFGFQNSFTINKLRLDVRFDGAQGGVIRSLTSEKLWWGGKHPNSTTYRDAEYAAGQNVYTPNGVNVTDGTLTTDSYGEVISDTRNYKENTTKVNWQTWCQNYPYRAAVLYSVDNEFANIYDRSFLKLRNITLSYDVTDILNLDGINKFEVSAYGYNLFLLTRVLLVDPDFGNDDQLQDPSARYMGLKINVSF